MSVDNSNIATIIGNCVSPFDLQSHLLEVYANAALFSPQGAIA